MALAPGGSGICEPQLIWLEVQGAVLDLQIVNRDLSIAVLRHFVKQCKAERDNGTAPRAKSRAKGGVMVGSSPPQEKVQQNLMLWMQRFVA